MAATTTHVAKCQQHYTSNDGHNLTERSLPSEMTSSPPVAAYSTAGNEPENDGVTKKSDSGVYFAMMLSEYLDKKAMEEDKGDATIVKPNSSSDESNTTTTTTTTTTTATTTTVEPATTTNSANDNVGRLGQHVPHGHPKDETYAEAQVKEVMANLPNLIWFVHIHTTWLFNPFLYSLCHFILSGFLHTSIHRLHRVSLLIGSKYMVKRRL